MVKQKTLNQKFSLKGRGLHTGLDVTITFNPAPDNHGYKIQRIDLEDKPVITASAENVIKTDRRTVLSSKGVQVSTVEHGLAALYACEIDNCLVEVDAPEFPILDGSSIEYVNKIIESGIKEQTAPRHYYIPSDKIECIDEISGSHLILFPSDNFRIHTQISYDSSVLEVQSAVLDDLSKFPQEIAMCRTFVFLRELETLIKKGLVKGGALNNAILIYDKPMKQERFDRLADIINMQRRDSSKLGYIISEALRYPNEPARHKILDILGDISLTGRFIKGTILAVCPGHRINNQFARIILREIKKEESNMVVIGNLHWKYTIGKSPKSDE